MRTTLSKLKPGDVFRFPWPSGIHVWLGERWVLTDGCVWYSVTPSREEIYVLVDATGFFDGERK